MVLCRQYLLKHSYFVLGVHLKMYQLCKHGSAQGEYGADAAMLGCASIEGPEGNQSGAISLVINEQALIVCFAARQTDVPAEEEPHFKCTNTVITLFSALCAPKRPPKQLAVQL